MEPRWKRGLRSVARLLLCVAAILGISRALELPTNLFVNIALAGCVLTLGWFGFRSMP